MQCYWFLDLPLQDTQGKTAITFTICKAQYLTRGLGRPQFVKM